MSTWTCSICNATGQQKDAKAARRAYEHHYAAMHKDEDW